MQLWNEILFWQCAFGLSPASGFDDSWTADRRPTHWKNDDDDCFYYHVWRNNVVIAFGTLFPFSLFLLFFVSLFLFVLFLFISFFLLWPPPLSFSGQRPRQHLGSRSLPFKCRWRSKDSRVWCQQKKKKPNMHRRDNQDSKGAGNVVRGRNARPTDDLSLARGEGGGQRTWSVVLKEGTTKAILKACQGVFGRLVCFCKMSGGYVGVGVPHPEITQVYICRSIWNDIIFHVKFLNDIMVMKTFITLQHFHSTTLQQYSESINEAVYSSLTWVQAKRRVAV